MARRRKIAETKNEIRRPAYEGCGGEPGTRTSALADLAAVAAAALRAEKKYGNSIAVADEAQVEVATGVESRKQKLERTREHRAIKLDA